MALAQELMGFPRHLSQHVGGFAITRSRLDEVVPVENAAMEERTVIEWDKDDLNDLEHPEGRRARARHAVVPAARHSICCASDYEKRYDSFVIPDRTETTTALSTG